MLYSVEISVEIVFLISCCSVFFLPTTLQLFNFAFRQITLDEAVKIGLSNYGNFSQSRKANITQLAFRGDLS